MRCVRMLAQPHFFAATLPKLLNRAPLRDCTGGQDSRRIMRPAVRRSADRIITRDISIPEGILSANRHKTIVDSL